MDPKSESFGHGKKQLELLIKEAEANPNKSYHGDLIAALDQLGFENYRFRGF